ncbi:hypothetical protein MF271_13820 [Deinococcus sp. KNUC1210]|uniref:hypothetical protein n=1 Tax=Deinococcus sp. KNUC1210 TaxID=2917691 RepID=UPI001EF0E8DB|nr:hypothetical protein [Deinococcus sp. KNUC1210]ULH15027.1 hypothetical protein MF271_13820 [Deinococcus sp. KNUC1210]
MSIMKKLSAFLSLSLAAALVACGGGSSGPDPLGAPLVLDHIQGTISDTLAAGLKMGVFLQNSVLTSATIGGSGAVDLPLTVPPASEQFSFLPASGSNCTYNGLGAATGTVFGTSDVVVYTSKADVLGTVIEQPVGQPATAELLHIYANTPQSYQGTVTCNGSSTATKVNVQFAAGWNAIIFDHDANGNVTIISAPTDTRVQLSLKRLTSSVAISLDTSSLSLQAGQSTTANAVILQGGGISGTLDLSTDVPGLTVTPASVSLPALNAQSVRSQPLLEALGNGARGVGPLDVAAQRLSTQLTFTASADAVGYNGTMNLIAKQGGVEVGRQALNLSLVAPGVSASFANGSYYGVSIGQGESIAIPVAVTSMNNYSGAVTVTLSGLPTGVSAATQVIQIMPNTTITVKIALSASSSAQVGTSQINILTTPSNLATYVSPLPLNILPARTNVGTSSGTLFAAKQGVWLTGESNYNAQLGMTVQTLSRYDGGVLKATHLLPSSSNLVIGRTGVLMALSTSYAGNSLYTNTVRSIQDDGSYQDVSFVSSIPFPQYYYSSRPLADLNGDIWYLDSGSLKKFTASSREITTINGITNLSFYSNLQLSQDGSTIYLYSGGPSTPAAFKVDVATGAVSSATYLSYGQLDSKGVVWGISNGKLAKMSTDGTLVAYNTIDVSALIGFDFKNPSVLWARSSNGIVKIDVSASPIPTFVLASPSSFQDATLSIMGGLDYIYSDYSNGYTYYLSHVN